LPFAHSLFADFLVAHGNVISKNTVFKQNPKAILGCLAVHVTGLFLRSARIAQDAASWQMNFVLGLPSEVFSLLQLLPALDPPDFPPLPLLSANNKDANPAQFYNNLSRIVCGSEMGVVAACLDDSADSITIAEILFSGRDMTEVAVNILWARFIRVSVMLLNVEPQSQYPYAAQKEGKHGEKCFYDLWRNVLASLCAINKCIRPDIFGNVARNEKWRDLLLAKQIASGLGLPLMQHDMPQDIATLGAQVTHNITRSLKQGISLDATPRGFWGFWQRLFCSLVVGGDLLTMIIWENWPAVTAPAGSALRPTMLTLARDFKVNEDINPLNAEQCHLMWRVIMDYHDRVPDASLEFLELCSEKTALLDTILRHCPPSFVTVLAETRSPSLFRYVRDQLPAPPSSSLSSSPSTEAVEHSSLTSVWTQAKEKVAILISNELRAFVDSSSKSISDWKDHNMERSLLVAVVLHNQYLVTRLLSTGMYSLDKGITSSAEKLHAAHVILSMIGVATSAQDMLFVLSNVVPWLRSTAMEVRRTVDDLRIRGKVGADFMDNLKTKLVTQATAATEEISSGSSSGVSDQSLSPVLETLALMFPSKETIGNFFALSAGAGGSLSGGATVTSILALVKQLQQVGAVSEYDYLELCYEYFGMEALQEHLFVQFTKRAAVRTSNDFALLKTAFSLLPGMFMPRLASTGQRHPGQCSAEARRCMSLFVLRWIAASLLENDWEACPPPHLASLRALLKTQLATLATSGLDETDDALAKAAGEGFLVLLGSGTADMEKWLVPPPVAYLVMLMYSEPTMETYVKLRSCSLSEEVKDRLIMSTVQSTGLFMAISMKERRYRNLFATLTKCSDDHTLGLLLESMKAGYSASHCWLSSSFLSTCADENGPIQLGNGTSASLALCQRNGYLACAAQWLVLMIARGGGEGGGTQLQQVESFLGHIHDSDIGEPSQQLCTCIAAFRANNVVALVESIHRTLQVALASVPPSLRRALEASEDWAPFGVVDALLSAVASAPWTEKEKVVKFVELYVLVTKSPRCAVAGCGCGVSLDHLALVRHSDNILRQFFLNMLGSKKKLESDERQELLSCMRPLLTYVALNPPWAAQSLTTHIMACLYQPGYITMVRMFQETGHARYFEQNSWAMLMKLVVGKSIHQAAHLLFTCELAARATAATGPASSLEVSRLELAEAARCAKSLGDLVQWTAVVLDLLPLWSTMGTVAVLKFLFSFTEEELSPAPKGSDTDGAVSDIWGAMFSKVSSSSAFSFDLLCDLLLRLPMHASTLFVRLRPVLAEMLLQGLTGERLLFEHPKLLPVWAILMHASPIDASSVARRVADYMMANTASIQRKNAFEKFLHSLKGVYEAAGHKDRWNATSQLMMERVASKKKVFEIVQSAKYSL
jgi:hypothetical protein